MVRDVIVCVLIVFVNVCGSLKCKSHTGEPVDWFTVYKLPEIHEVGIDKWSYYGVGFYYMDSNSPSWKLSSVPFNQTGHSVEYTLRQIYKNTTSEYMYSMYNDQPPQGRTSLNHGHTKGVFAFDKSEGFWLIMSIPHFPPPRSFGFSYPDSGEVYGQSIFCVSLQYSAIESVAKIMTFTYPKFYDHYLPPSFSSENPIMTGVLSGSQKHVTSPPFQLETTLHTTDGVVLHNFAKSNDFEKDLYDAWINERINHDLFVETWQNGRGPLESNCTERYKVYNIQKIRFPNGDFKETKDHSKWAVSRTGSWICIGDINRQLTQFHRGGSTTCMSDPHTWKQYTNIIRDIETCGPIFG
ncbi:deoxyribonuclease-2-alpha-like isoform X2 [Saccostrea echinata]|uniref:deoxyribonuclease-2-alpha-like isoform X2 n=1 Tax=Saccostrea echinata TaxID=191078 RepID=UPI002A7FF36E|nr:deoxyribonuclease-2-alpha-like isoform X2 [Saccostrea echinata]